GLESTEPPPVEEITNGGVNGEQISTAHGQYLSKILTALLAFRKGDFNVRLPDEWTGLEGKIADTFNDVLELIHALPPSSNRMGTELERVALVVGREGRISERAVVFEASGSWAASIASVNTLVGDLVHPTRDTARVIGAVAKGDLSQMMALDVDGRPLHGEFL